jgi:hypothetical protein
MTELSGPPAGPAARPPIPTGDQPYGFEPLVATAYRGLLGNFGAFLTAAFIPWLLALGTQVLLTRALATTLQEAIATGTVNSASFLAEFQGTAQGYLFLELGVGLLTSVVFAVAWHRFMLGHERPRLLPGLGKRHVLFFFYSLFLALPIIGFAVLGGIVGGALNARSELVTLLPIVALGGVGLYLSIRMNLCLPAAAVDEPGIGPGRSWEVMRGRVLVFFLATLACVVPLALVLGLMNGPGQEWMQRFVITGEGFVSVLLLQAVSGLLALMIAALGVGALSQALRSLIPDPSRL